MGRAYDTIHIVMLYHILHMAIQLCEEGTMARRIWKGSNAPFLLCTSAMCVFMGFGLTVGPFLGYLDALA